MSALDWSILWPACAAGFLVAATHVPLGIRVLDRGIVFIDLAIAQIAGLGVVAAGFAGFEANGAAVQGCALAAALAGAAVLTWTDRRWPEVQEATIGVAFVLAASGALLLLAKNPHGGEHLKELLVGQILWVSPSTLPWVAAAYAALLVLMSRRSERTADLGFYLVFAIAVTISVQLVGLYLVFATLIIPALATRRLKRGRLAAGYAVGAGGYVLGLLIAAAADLPPGPAIVCALVAVAIAAAIPMSRAAR